MQQQGGRGIHVQYGYKPDRSLWCWEKEKKSKTDNFFQRYTLLNYPCQVSSFGRNNAIFHVQDIVVTCKFIWWLAQAVEKENMQDSGKPIDEKLTVRIKH